MKNPFYSRDCNCTPAFFATYIPSPKPVCVGPNKLCMSRVMEDIGSERFVEDGGERKECLAACQDQTHQAGISQ